MDSINYGTVPTEILVEYINVATMLKAKHPDIKTHEELSLKAYEKFKKCRTEASQNSVKKSRTLPMDVILNLFRSIPIFLKIWKNRNMISSKE